MVGEKIIAHYSLHLAHAHIAQSQLVPVKKKNHTNHSESDALAADSVCVSYFSAS